MPGNIRSNFQRIKLDRRCFLKGAAACLALSSIPIKTADAFDWDAFLQKHFRVMTDEEIKKVIERLEKEASLEWKKEIHIRSTKATPNVTFAYGLDLSRCIGCRRCVYACVEENNQSRIPQIHWISVLRFKKGDKWIDLENSEKYYDAKRVPEKDFFYMPVQYLRAY